MTRKDFVKIAKVINAVGDEMCDSGHMSQYAFQTLAYRFADMLATTNANFDRMRFFDACEHYRDPTE